MRLRVAAIVGVSLAVVLSFLIALPALTHSSYEQLLDRWNGYTSPSAPGQ